MTPLFVRSSAVGPASIDASMSKRAAEKSLIWRLIMARPSRAALKPEVESIKYEDSVATNSKNTTSKTPTSKTVYDLFLRYCHISDIFPLTVINLNS